MDLELKDFKLNNENTEGNPSEFSVEDILAEYSATAAVIEPKTEITPDTSTERIYMRPDVGNTVSTEFSSKSFDEPLDDMRIYRLKKEVEDDVRVYNMGGIDSDMRVYDIGDALKKAAEMQHDEIMKKYGADDDIDSDMKKWTEEVSDFASSSLSNEADSYATLAYDEDHDMKLHSDIDKKTELEDTDKTADAQQPKKKKSIKVPRIKKGSYFYAILAGIAFRVKKISFPDTDVDFEGEPESEPDVSEVSDYYLGYMRTMRLRLIPAAVLTLIILWISFNLPSFGALRTDTAVRAMVCLILQLSVMMLCLDQFTAGIMSIFRGKISIWSLISIFCIMTAIDALLTATTVAVSLGTPLCALSSCALFFSLVSAYLNCRSTYLSCRCLELSGSVHSLTAEYSLADKDIRLIKSERELVGYIDRCESPDCIETGYGTAAPFILFAVLLLSIIAAAINGQWSNFFRIASTILAPAVPFSALLAFALPYSFAAQRFFKMRVALAGWPGLREIGKARNLIIRDRDLFPRGTVTLGEISIVSDMSHEQIVSYTGSLVFALGGALAPAFAEYMKKYNYTMQTVENFERHIDGGAKALVNGISIVLGNLACMENHGVRPIQEHRENPNKLYVLLNGSLEAMFDVHYRPTGSVQDALNSLVYARRRPVFAVSDFNITKLFLKEMFRLPSGDFDFYAKEQAQELSELALNGDGPVSAIIASDGLSPLVEISEYGRRLYIIIRLFCIISAVISVIGIVLMFWMMLTGAYSSADVSSILTYMLISLLPVIILTFGLNR